MRALLLEDDLTAARGVALTLKAAGMVCDQADTGEEALELLRHYDYDIVVADIVLPDMDGYEALRRMRAARIGVPAIMLSGLARTEAKVKAFAAGADDYLTKPFDRSELIARIQAVVRRNKGFSHPALRIGQLELNIDSHEVRVGGSEVRLTGKEYAMLELLALRRGMTLSKEVFLNHLYGGMDEPDSKIVDVFICKLRKKLADAGAPDLIGTVWGRGYIMRDTAPSTPAPSMPAPPTSATPAPAAERALLAA